VNECPDLRLPRSERIEAAFEECPRRIAPRTEPHGGGEERPRLRRARDVGEQYGQASAVSRRMITDGKDINLRDSLAPVCDVTRHSSFGARRVAAEWS